MKDNNSDTKQTLIPKTDAFVKAILETDLAAREFLEEYLPKHIKDLLDLSKITIEKESFVEEDLRRRLSDIIYAVKSKNGDKAYILTIIEHQSTSDKWIALRLWKYTLLLLERYMKENETFPLVAQIVIYNGKQKYTAPQNLWELFVHPLMAKDLITSNYTLVDLNAMSDDDIKKKQHLGMFEYVLKHIHMRDMISLMRKFMNEYHEAILIDKNNDYIYFKRILCYIGEMVDVHERSTFNQIILENLPNNDGEKIMTTLAESYRKEGREKGKEEGILTMAKNMLKAKIDIKLIASITGLSEEKLKSLITAK